MTWRTIDSGLPDLDQVVLVRYPSSYDGADIYAWGARVFEDEGWLWALGTRGIRPDKDATWNGLEADDEYPVTHWQPLPAPPEGE